MNPFGEATKINGVVAVRMPNNETIMLILESGTVLKFNRQSEVCWVSMGNMPFAMIEPNLFVYWVLDNGNLQVICPYCNGGKSNVEIWLKGIESGKIVI